MNPKYAIKREDNTDVPVPYAALIIGLCVIWAGSVLPWGVYDDALWTSPVVVGLVIAVVFPIVILGNRDIAQSTRNIKILIAVCVIFASHGLWWRWYWMNFSLRIDDLIVWIVPQWKSWNGIDPIDPPAVFGGLMLLTVLLAIPIWILTHCRIMMLFCFAAALLPGAIFVRWGGYSWIHGDFDLFMEFVIDPVNTWFMLILLPLARRARVSQLEYVDDRCHFCGYSLEGLHDKSICTECGKYPFILKATRRPLFDDPSISVTI